MTAMTHLEALAKLSPEQKADLTTLDTRKGLFHLASHVLAIFVCGAYIALKGPFWGALLFPQGILLVFLFTLSHECTHATPFAHKRLNDIVGHLVSPVIALPFMWFRYLHLAHHRHTNDPTRDPELDGTGKPNTVREYLIYVSGLKYWPKLAGVIWTNARGRMSADYLPKRQYPAMQREARVLIAIYTLVGLSLIWTPVLLWIWIVPVLLAQPVLRLFLLAEHGHCPHVANMLENTRSTRTLRVVRWLAWNMPYHAEHHSFPTVPFHKLPELHEHLAPHLQSVSDGYTGFTRAYVQGLER